MGLLNITRSRFIYVSCLVQPTRTTKPFHIFINHCDMYDITVTRITQHVCKLFSLASSNSQRETCFQEDCLSVIFLQIKDDVRRVIW